VRATAWQDGRVARTLGSTSRGGGSTSLRDRIALSDAAEEAARAAGVLVHRAFRTRFEVEEKAEKDLVTAWDRRSEALITEHLAAAFPDVALVGEETHGPDTPMPELAFVVDPIDGTTNFAHGHPFWCVSIGVFDAGVPVAGAILAPALRLAWKAALDPAGPGSLALRDGAACRVTTRRALRECLVATGFPPNRDVAPDNNFDSFMAVKRRAQAVRRCGSAAIDIAFVGDGTYDAYWERRLHVWDCAAAAALVLAAGGRVTALDGGAPVYGRGHLAISNGLVHDELVAAIADR
jgi:myo-inositol-1(or 4)-monophosphatase